jgi:hypothetical protein
MVTRVGVESVDEFLGALINVAGKLLELRPSSLEPFRGIVEFVLQPVSVNSFCAWRFVPSTEVRRSNQRSIPQAIDRSLPMNTSEETITRQVLESLSEVTFLFRDRAVALERLPEVKEVLTALEFYETTSGSPMLSGYVDAALNDGTGTTWAWDLTWTDETWIIECKLDRSIGGEQELLQELPPTTVQTVRELPPMLVETARQMLQLRPSWLGAD